MNTHGTTPKLLLVNDDGIDAPGLQALRRALAGTYEVLVAAPLYEKSGAGCSLSLSNEMEIAARRENGQLWGYSIDGTPADCVKFALTELRTRHGFEPDLVLSGINRGLNAGNSVFYSGTVAAAIEATLYGSRAMACSLSCWGHPVPFYEDAARAVEALVPWILRAPMPPRTVWNLNIPNARFGGGLPPLRLTNHGTSFYADDFELYRQEGDRLYYRNVGTHLTACALSEDSDDRCVSNGELSLSLLRTDLSCSPPQGYAEDLQGYWNGGTPRPAEPSPGTQER